MLLPDDLQIDYQFTFNLSKHEDRHIRQINFFNIPTKSDVDTDFDIFCSKDTKIKISAKTSKYASTFDFFGLVGICTDVSTKALSIHCLQTNVSFQ